MGLIPGTVVTYVKAAPMGDPIEYRIWDYELTLRMSEAKQIRIAKVEADQQKEKKQKSRNTKVSLHPGLGERGNYRKRRTADFWTCRKPELWQDNIVQSAYRFQSTCWKFPGRNRRPQRWSDTQAGKHAGYRLAGYLFDVSVYE